MTIISDSASEPKPSEPTPPRLLTRRTVLVGGAAVAGIAVLEGTYGRSQRRAQAEQDRKDQEIEHDAHNAYVKAFFAGETTRLTPGDKNKPIQAFNTKLAELRDIHYYLKTVGDEAAYDHYAGVQAAELIKDYPTWGNPPHVRISNYTGPRYYVIGPESSELIGFPEDGTLPSELELTCDAGEAFAGDVSVSVGNTEMRVTNNGLAEQGVHIFLRPS